MCGRFTQAMPWSAVWAFSQPLALAVPDEPLVPRYNIAPTQSAWVIASDGHGGAKAGTMRWGLVPHWGKDLKLGLSSFNARIETAAAKPTFRQAFERRHCLLPASGYYEWVSAGKAKQPWYIRPVDAPMMLFAGLWDRWQSPDGTTLLSFTVLTQAADGELASLHDRRPVMVPPSKIGYLQNVVGTEPEVSPALLSRTAPPRLECAARTRPDSGRRWLEPLPPKAALVGCQPCGHASRTASWLG